MNYTIRTEYKNGTIEFYYTFDDYSFIQYLSKRKNLKNEVGALSFAISTSKKTVRVIMPIGTSEKDFNEKMNKFFQKECNMQPMFDKYGTSDAMNSFASLFGNLFGG